MQNTIGFSFRLKEDEAKQVKRRAEENKWSAAFWVKEAVREKLKRENQQNEAS